MQCHFIGGSRPKVGPIRRERHYNSSMTRALGIATWFLFAAMMYLITAEALGPWLTLPALAMWVSLWFSCYSRFCTAAGAKGLENRLFFASAASISYLFEEIGVRTGVIYGPYHYSDMLGLKLGHVPILIPLAWFMMIYPSWRVAGALLRPVQTDSLVGIVARALIGAMVMTAWDTVMDPGMAAAAIGSGRTVVLISAFHYAITSAGC